MRKQPDDTACPIVSGSLDPWMRHSREPRYMARAPSGLSIPPGMWRGRSGRRASICAGGVQAGPSLFAVMRWGPLPAETAAADADAVAQRLAVAGHEIEPPLAGVDEDGSGRVVGLEHHRG